MTEANVNYTLRVSEPGFVTRDVAVSVGMLPTAVDVVLARITPPPGGCVTNQAIPALSNWALLTLFLFVAVSGSIIIQRSAINSNA